VAGCQFAASDRPTLKNEGWGTRKSKSRSLAAFSRKMVDVHGEDDARKAELGMTAVALQ
jgi:hypothetical protein